VKSKREALKDPVVISDDEEGKAPGSKPLRGKAIKEPKKSNRF